MPNYHADIICQATFQADSIENARKITNELAKDLAATIDVGHIHATQPGHTWQEHARKTREENHPGAFTYLEMEAALCVWECLNDWTLHSEAHRDDWVKLREAVGSVELRYQSIELGQWALKVYNFCIADDPELFDGTAYDWEVIPMILGYARNEDGPVIYADHLPEPATVAELVKAQHIKNEWFGQARRQAAKLWYYPELISDHINLTEKAFADGENPEAFAKWLGEKLDLTPASAW